MNAARRGGAVRRGAVSSSRRLSARGWLLAGGGLLLAVVVAVVLVLKPAAPWLPIRRLVVEAPFVEVSLEEIRQRIEPRLGGGFFAADLEAMAAELEGLPWVQQAAVRRLWPDALRVEIWEQQPVARWGEVALVNAQGKIFASQTEAVGLPLLNGPAGSSAEVLAAYRACERVLREREMTLTQLVVDHRGSWRATLAEGVELRLGQGAPQTALREFVGAGLAALRGRLEEIAHIDLRYPNGFAVAARSQSGQP